MLAGGVESASTAPLRFWPPASPPVRYERAPFAPADLGDPEMGQAADVLAEKAGITRERQDAYAARSHALAADDPRRRRLRRRDRPGAPAYGATSGLAPGSTAERLARLRPAFRAAEEGGTVTAGNSCGINDGAAVVAMVDADTHRRLGCPGSAGARHRDRGRATRTCPASGWCRRPARSWTVRGSASTTSTWSSSTRRSPARCWPAATPWSSTRQRVCVEGGALALGHPWGASGAVLVVRLFSQLVRADRGRYGLAAIAVGGGQGVAMVVERCR